MSTASATYAERCGGSDHLQSGSVARDLGLRRWPALTWQSQQHGLEEVLASTGLLMGRLRRSSQSLRWSTRHIRERTEPSRRHEIWGVPRRRRGGWSARRDACRRSPERLGVAGLCRTRPGQWGRLRRWSLRQRRWLQARIGWIGLLISLVFGLVCPCRTQHFVYWK
ncbi:hypothetical protein M6B38_199125 [Iris pallida]|uniref:Uncharacterized protein n=1 Tax=Iris pallida TaxID=29817 RepID=A0AAX6EB71_IRIPA|nr:hypothetical protein M6B38_199125 [Iris pallida]